MNRFISRRSFLKAAGVGAMSVGFIACGDNSSQGENYKSVSDVNSNDFEGFTIAEAQEYSEQSNCPYFVKKSDEKFYPMTTVLHERLSGNMSPRAAFLDEYCLSFGEEFKSLSVCLSESDEVVFVSDSISIGDSIDLIPALQVGWTIPFGFEFSSTDFTYLYLIKTFCGVEDFRVFSQYDPSGPDTFSVTVNDHAEINGLSLEELITQRPKYSSYAHMLNSGKEKDGEEIFVEFNSNEKVSFEYYEGSTYHSVELTANTKFIRFNPADKISCKMEFVKDGYAKISTENIGNGTYLIKHPYYSIYVCFEILQA